MSYLLKHERSTSTSPTCRGTSSGTNLTCVQVSGVDQLGLYDEPRHQQKQRRDQVKERRRRPAVHPRPPQPRIGPHGAARVTRARRHVCAETDAVVGQVAHAEAAGGQEEGQQDDGAADQRHVGVQLPEGPLAAAPAEPGAGEEADAGLTDEVAGGGQHGDAVPHRPQAGGVAAAAGAAGRSRPRPRPRPRCSPRVRGRLGHDRSARSCEQRLTCSRKVALVACVTRNQTRTPTHARALVLTYGYVHEHTQMLQGIM